MTDHSGRLYPFRLLSYTVNLSILHSCHAFQQNLNEYLLSFSMSCNPYKQQTKYNDIDHHESMKSRSTCLFGLISEFGLVKQFFLSMGVITCLTLEKALFT